MRQKQVLLSALSVVGVSIGLRLAFGQTVGRWRGVNSSPEAITEEQIEQELLRQVVHGRESGVTFDKFPYFLNEQTQELLTSVAYVYLKHSDFSKYTRNLTPASRAILLSGPAEFYQQTLAKALAHFFEAELLLLDVNDFSLQLQSKYGCPKKESEVDVILTVLISFVAHFKRTINWPFDERHLLQSLYKVLVSVSGTRSIILYIRDVEKFLLYSGRFYKLFKKMLAKLSGSVLILGSRVFGHDDKGRKLDEKVSLLFPYNIEIKAPKDEICLDTWKTQLEEETKMIQFQEKKNHIAEVLTANDLDCDDLGSIRHADSMILSKCIEEIVLSAISYHLMNNKDPEYRNGKLVISSKSLSHGLSIFQEGKTGGKATLKTKPASSKWVPPDNEFEEHLRSEVVPANELGVTFDDIGALDDVKESLHELVMLPLHRPDLFKGGLLKPCRGILLFGPPGTGKTMLAKAIASEAGASFINVKTSSITSKWFGDDEKTVRALFTLAAKVSPTIIFVDEVDSMLGHRSMEGGYEALRKIKNEFMTHWDGLMTKAGEQILVLAATNRPFDLDEAVIRRFERRIMVGLPSKESREMILRTLLAKEKAEVLDYKELAIMTEGYTGSDLKNLCVTAAYRPVKELLQQERMMKDKQKKQKADEGQSSEDGSDTIEEAQDEKGIVKRPLNMEDMRKAKNQVAASFGSEGGVTNELRQWNELYGESGSRKMMQGQLTYFLSKVKISVLGTCLLLAFFSVMLWSGYLNLVSIFRNDIYFYFFNII